MANYLPPPPVVDNKDSYSWLEWFRQLRNYITQTGSVPWSIINFSGSNLTDIVTRSHQNLQSLQGGTAGQYYHLTSAEYSHLQGYFNYGGFYDTTTQTAAAINTAYAVTFNSVYDNLDGITLGTPTSRIVVSKAGTYNLHCTLQTDKTSASAGTVWMWLRVNGVDHTASTAKHIVNGSTATSSKSLNFIHECNANDYLEVMWATNDTTCQLTATAASSPIPAIPSASVQIFQVK